MTSAYRRHTLDVVQADPDRRIVDYLITRDADGFVCLAGRAVGTPFPTLRRMRRAIDAQLRRPTPWAES